MLWRFLSYLFGSRRTPAGTKRSPQWRAVQKKWLRANPRCQVCNKKWRCVPHHVVPFHIDGSLELRFDNLMTLCPVHHLWIGHLGDFHSWNASVRSDALVWQKKIASRPKRGAR